MLRSLLSSVVLLGFIQTPHSYPNQPINPNQEYELYLPLAIDAYPPIVDVVKLGIVDYEGYPGEVCLYGYTTGNTPTAAYSVTLAIDVAVFPYCGPEPSEDCLPYSVTYYAEPELEATLPDQVNPFSYCLLYSKGFYSYGAVELASANLNPPNGRVIYPLMITSWTKKGTEWETTISGTVRNDSGHRLDEIRVVGIAGLCEAKEAELRSTVLNPGMVTTFIFKEFYCQTIWPNLPTEMVEISAQGVAEP